MNTLQFEHRIYHWTGQSRISLLARSAIPTLHSTQGKVGVAYFQIGYPNFLLLAEPSKYGKAPKPLRFKPNLVYTFLRCFLAYWNSLTTPTNKQNREDTSSRNTTNDWNVKCEANKIERLNNVFPRVRILIGCYISVGEAMSGHPWSSSTRVPLNHFSCSTRWSFSLSSQDCSPHKLSCGTSHIRCSPMMPSRLGAKLQE